MSEPNPFRDPLSDIPEMAASWTERLHRSTGSDKPKPQRQEVDDVRINTWSAYAPPPWGGRRCCLYRRKSSASEARTSRRRRDRFPARPFLLLAAIHRRILSPNELLGSRPARTCMFQDFAHRFGRRRPCAFASSPLCQLRGQLEAREGFRMRELAKRPRRERRAEAERALDEAIEGSFPASDPLASTRTIAGGPIIQPRRRGASGPSGEGGTLVSVEPWRSAMYVVSGRLAQIPVFRRGLAERAKSTLCRPSGSSL